MKWNYNAILFLVFFVIAALLKLEGKSSWDFYAFLSMTSLLIAIYHEVTP